MVCRTNGAHVLHLDIAKMIVIVTNREQHAGPAGVALHLLLGGIGSVMDFTARVTQQVHAGTVNVGDYGPAHVHSVVLLGHGAEVGKVIGADGNGEWRAGGMMIQSMPKASPFAKDGGTGEGGLLRPEDLLRDDDDGENWRRVNFHLDTVDELELIGPDLPPTDLLVRVYHEENPRVFDAQPVRFGCTCSEDRVRQSLSIYSAKDIAHMTTPEGLVTADCQFCGAHYELDPQTVGFEADK